jgi:predicted RNA binding protein with dsRBD fold (UPF0201 family)
MTIEAVPRLLNPIITHPDKTSPFAATALCKWPQPRCMDTAPEDTPAVPPAVPTAVPPTVTSDIPAAISPAITPDVHPETNPSAPLETTPTTPPETTPEVWVDTAVEAHESLEVAITSVQAIFPDWIPTDYEPSGTFPRLKQHNPLTAAVSNIDKLLELCSKQRILDTALDAMTMDRSDDAVMFQLGRQAALAGKISFVLTGERALGGVMQVTMVGVGIIEWLEEATWHSGRNDIPRLVGDELRMDHDGEPVEWFDNAGRPTFYTDEPD